MKVIILQRALNHLLEVQQIDIRSLAGKTVHFALQDLPLEANFICANERVFVTTETVTADVDIKLQSNVFLSLFQGEDLTELLRQDKIIIHGDVKTAQLLVDLLQQVDIDFEELLSQYTGDIVAHQVGKIAKKLKSLDDPLAVIKEGVTNFLIRPKTH
jgi:ubiquinone biosynthesis protein UbiJ